MFTFSFSTFLELKSVLRKGLRQFLLVDMICYFGMDHCNGADIMTVSDVQVHKLEEDRSKGLVDSNPDVIFLITPYEELALP